MNGLIASVSSKEDAQEVEYIYKVFFVGIHARKLGRDAYNRMKKGDFTNTPKIKEKIKEKIVEQIIDKQLKETDKHLKGYDINAE